MSEIDDDEIVAVGTPFPKLAAISALDGFNVLVKWNDGRQVVVDLAPTILTFKVYAPLRNDRALFATVHVVNESVIAWSNDEAIDMHVSEIDRLADEVMDGGSFQAFLKEMGLTWDAAAAVLGLSRRTVGYYAKGARIPRHIGLACAYLKLQSQTEDSITPERVRGGSS